VRGVAANDQRPEPREPLGVRKLNESALGSAAAGSLPLLVLAAGLIARLAQAQAYFFNPDEALHVQLASQATVGLAYRAALTNAHPPLLILVLYYWRWLGQSELMLRLPSVLAGTAGAWMTYQWLELVTDRFTAFVGLLLLSFAPALIGLSAEVRQYALLWLFLSGCLYLSERAVRQSSPALMILFSLSLLGALLSHYSALIFAFAMGVYMLVRLVRHGKARRGVAVAWVCGQIAAAALAGYFLVTHVAGLRQEGTAQGSAGGKGIAAYLDAAEPWLRRSFFHSSDTNVALFIAAQTVGVFTFLLAHGAIGTLTLAAFLLGMASLLRRKEPFQEEGPRPRELALLLGLPFAVTCGAALAGLYPYGGTRHSAVLALFGLSGASVGLAAWPPARERTKALVVAGCLVLCNLLPAPPPPIRPGNHARALMAEAVDYLHRSAPSGSLIFADYQSGLLLGRYVCGQGVVQIFAPLRPLVRSACGPYSAITTYPAEWQVRPAGLTGQVADIARTYNLAPGTKIWWLDAGWIADSAPRSAADVQRLGCAAPRFFGKNIFLCELTVSTGRDRF
jgi:hypothetical protein